MISLNVLVNVSIAMLITIFIFLLIRRGDNKKNPTFFHMFFERVYFQFDSLSKELTNNRKAASIIKLAFPMVVFLSVSNLMGLVNIPILYSADGKEVLLAIGAATSNLAVTLGFSTVILILSLFFILRFGDMKEKLGLLLILPFFHIGLNSATLAIRLFANMLSGWIQDAVFGGMIDGGPWASPGNFITSLFLSVTAIMAILSSIIQAYLFTTLSVVYLAQFAGYRDEKEEAEFKDEQLNEQLLEEKHIKIKERVNSLQQELTKEE